MRYVNHRHLGVLGVLAVGVLCGCSPPRQATLSAEVTDSLEKAVNSADVKGCAARFTDDAEVLQEDAAVVRGKQAIIEFCSAQIHPQLSLDIVSAMSIVSGDLAFEQGTYRVRNVKIGVNVEFGEYLNVWRRHGTQWQIFRSMFDKTDTLPTEVSVSEPDPD
jgi:ketosteroid isomerase-like protein